jgi:hypothetical protein
MGGLLASVIRLQKIVPRPASGKNKSRTYLLGCLIFPYSKDTSPEIQSTMRRKALSEPHPNSLLSSLTETVNLASLSCLDISQSTSSALFLCTTTKSFGTISIGSRVCQKVALLRDGFGSFMQYGWNSRLRGSVQLACIICLPLHLFLNHPKSTYISNQHPNDTGARMTKALVPHGPADSAEGK